MYAVKHLGILYTLTLTWSLILSSLILVPEIFKWQLHDVINTVNHRVTHDNMYVVNYLGLLYTFTLTLHLFFSSLGVVSEIFQMAIA